MTYPTISARRIPYDLDGSTVGYRVSAGVEINLATLFGNGVSTWITGANLTAFNGESRGHTIGYTNNGYPMFGVWIFFPELRNVTRIGFQYPLVSNYAISEHKIQGSADTTNGIDGTWEDATYTLPTSNLNHLDNWRDNTFAVAFSGAVKCVRVGHRNQTAYASQMQVCAIHLYGTKAAGETTNDLIFTDTSGTELTALKDWGDRPEGSTATYSFKVKNVGASACTGITITSSNTTLTMSWLSGSGFTDELTIASLGADSLSDTIYVRHTLGEPPLTLGPVAARIYMTGTWS
jgi:hypothetical protein